MPKFPSDPHYKYITVEVRESDHDACMCVGISCSHSSMTLLCKSSQRHRFMSCLALHFTFINNVVLETPRGQICVVLASALGPLALGPLALGTLAPGTLALRPMALKIQALALRAALTVFWIVLKLDVY